MFKGQNDFNQQQSLLKDQHNTRVCHHCNKKVRVLDSLNETCGTDNEEQDLAEEMVEWVGTQPVKNALGVITQQPVRVASKELTVRASNLHKHLCSGCQHYTCPECMLACASCYKQFCKFCINKYESICEEDRRCSGCEAMSL